MERVLARIAAEARGLVTHGQMVDAGVTLGEIRWRLGTGALLREHPGVYRVGHRAKREATKCRAIPVTTVARTLVDLAAVLDAAQPARACHEAGVRHHTTPAEVDTVLERRPRSPGAGKLRRIMRGDTRVNPSRLESRFLERLKAAGLPLPETNRVAGGRRVDCRWPDLNLTVEHSYRYHHSRHAWEQDRRREREARARDDEFRRYTYGDVFERPKLMLTELRALLEPHRPALLS
ncbi:MAG: hypothetical protein ACXWEE_00420 [Thermoleophilaceae bacterium]